MESWKDWPISDTVITGKTLTILGLCPVELLCVMTALFCVLRQPRIWSRAGLGLVLARHWGAQPGHHRPMLSSRAVTVSSYLVLSNPSLVRLSALHCRIHRGKWLVWDNGGRKPVLVLMTTGYIPGDCDQIRTDLMESPLVQGPPLLRDIKVRVPSPSRPGGGVTIRLGEHVEV